jgi:hypothetical protein
MKQPVEAWSHAFTGRVIVVRRDPPGLVGKLVDAPWGVVVQQEAGAAGVSQACQLAGGVAQGDTIAVGVLPWHSGLVLGGPTEAC